MQFRHKEYKQDFEPELQESRQTVSEDRYWVIVKGTSAKDSVSEFDLRGLWLHSVDSLSNNGLFQRCSDKFLAGKRNWMLTYSSLNVDIYIRCRIVAWLQQRGQEAASDLRDFSRAFKGRV